VQEACNAVEDIAASKEAAKDLGVPSMNPFATELPRVLSFDDRKIITHVRPIDEFVHVRLKEEWLAEPEIGDETHSSVRHGRGINGFTGTSFA